LISPGARLKRCGKGNNAILEELEERGDGKDETKNTVKEGVVPSGTN
jgi:hypothetical protein